MTVPDLDDLGDERSVERVMDELRPELPADWVAEQLALIARQLGDRAAGIRHGKRGERADAFRRSGASMVEECVRQLEAEAAAQREELAERSD
jgi:hypothetical protein